MNDLKSCPFCGSSNISSGEVLSGQMGDYAKQTACLDCGATGPEVKMTLAMASGPDGDDLADAAWNRRAAYGVRVPVSPSADGPSQ